ncbi:MAG TPA: glycosyltransferase [Pseudonocardiaceae bacterium]|jgi:UDP-N-acetylglucosamine transferase subunit ALG13|nr:glycosyltransferase [Pseudonocardiaceae bacterium]
MTTLFLATIGGHLTQLNELSTRVPTDGDPLWVTNASEQSTSLLAGRDVQYVPYVGTRSVVGVLRCIPAARRLVNSRKLTRAVSTGSAIALGYLPYLAARGVECHYIESATRVRGPSLTGRILQWVPGVRTYTQYPQWENSRWRYAGSVFDGYEAVPAPPQLGDQVRVVVTAGAATEYPFRRLFERLVPLLVPDGELHRVTARRPIVLWQTGDTEVGDLPIHPLRALPAAELAAALARADIVVSHAGTGSALAALDSGRFPLLVPRAAGQGEAPDNHQPQLAGELARRGLALHREADSVTVDDLLATLSVAVRRSATPPPFELG